MLRGICELYRKRTSDIYTVSDFSVKVDWTLNILLIVLATELRAFHVDLSTDLSPLSVHYDNCVTTHTPCRRPYVDLVSPSLGVALGGNGYAAKSADEIGRIAADLLVSGQWSDDLPRETFRAARVTSVVTSAASGTSKLWGRQRRRSSSTYRLKWLDDFRATEGWIFRDDWRLLKYVSDLVLKITVTWTTVNCKPSRIT